MSPLFVVTVVHLRLDKAPELARDFPARPIAFGFSYFDDLRVVWQHVHVDPHTLVEDPVAHFISLLISQHLTSSNGPPKALESQRTPTSVLRCACLDSARAPTVSTDMFWTFFSYSGY